MTKQNTISNPHVPKNMNKKRQFSETISSNSIKDNASVSKKHVFGRILQDITNIPAVHGVSDQTGGSGSSTYPARESQILQETQNSQHIFPQRIEDIEETSTPIVKQTSYKTRDIPENSKRTSTASESFYSQTPWTNNDMPSPTIDRYKSVIYDSSDEDNEGQTYDCSSPEEYEDDNEPNEHDDSEVLSEVQRKLDYLNTFKNYFAKFFPDVCSSKPVPKKSNSAYLDHGDPKYECEFCGALMWYDERINKHKKTRKPVFSLCCGLGQVKLPFLKQTPELLVALLTNNDELSRHFRENIRAYNMIFSFTSLGGEVDTCIQPGRGPNMFQLQGENYHLMGSLKPEKGKRPKFQQLYIVDTENEVDNRATAMSKGKNAGKYKKKQKLRLELIEKIMKMLDENNPYVEKFRSARERFDTNPDETFHMRIVSSREKDGRTYNTPTASEVAALIPGDFSLGMDHRDIVIQERSGELQRISEISAFMKK